MSNSNADWREELIRLATKELQGFAKENLIVTLGDAPAGVLDVLYAYRLFLGRWPEFNSVREYQDRTARSLLRDFTKGFIDSSEFRARVSDVASVDMVVTRQLPGMRLTFNLSDKQAVRIAMRAHEPEIQLVMRRMLKPGMNCIDAGAHIGLFTMIMASIAGSSSLAPGRVFSFEPTPSTYELLSQNVRDNGYENIVHLTKAACHAAPGTARLFFPETEDMGPAFVRPVAEAHAPGIMDVPMVRIDDIVPRDVRIGLVKMDIEGNEPFALEGMTRILKHDRPILFLEFIPHALGVDPQAHLGALRKLGYVVHETTSLVDGVPSGLGYEYVEGNPTTNLVALPG